MKERDSETKPNVMYQCNLLFSSFCSFLPSVCKSTILICSVCIVFLGIYIGIFVFPTSAPQCTNKYTGSISHRHTSLRKHHCSVGSDQRTYEENGLGGRLSVDLLQKLWLEGDHADETVDGHQVGEDHQHVDAVPEQSPQRGNEVCIQPEEENKDTVGIQHRTCVTSSLLILSTADLRPVMFVCTSVCPWLSGPMSFISSPDYQTLLGPGFRVTSCFYSSLIIKLVQPKKYLHISWSLSLMTSSPC